MLFDDDTVDTIKESEIPNYFGDSPKGSAYVLYYQAVDLDMAALGLRPQVPLAPSTPASTAATSSAVDKIPSLSELEVTKHEPESPPLPPGLEPGKSDVHDSPTLGSPALPPVVVLPNDDPPPLGLLIPPTAQHTGSPPLSGFSGKILNLTSRLANGNGTNGEIGKSPREPMIPGSPLSSPTSPALPRRPATSHSTYTPDNSHGSDPSSPSTWRAMPNDLDKERLPEKKSSRWFNLRSSRAESSFSGVPSGTPTTVPERRASTVRDKGDGKLRRSQAFQDGKLLDTTTPASPSQSSASNASLPGSPIPPFREESSPPLLPNRLHSEHKKSMPEFTRTKKQDRHRSSTARSTLPPRPSTAEPAGSSFRHQRSTSLVPPMPPMPVSPGTILNGESLTAEPEQYKGKERDDTGSVSVETSHEGNTPGNTHHRGPSGAIPVPVGLGFTPSESTTSSLSVSEPPAHTSSIWAKRATRKLSLTTPKLGFVRRDKDRHKDKDKDHSALLLSRDR